MSLTQPQTFVIRERVFFDKLQNVVFAKPTKQLKILYGKIVVVGSE